MARNSRRRQRRSATAEHHHEGGATESQESPRGRQTRISREPTSISLPADLTLAMRADWHAADPKTTDAIIDAVWARLRRHRLRGRDGDGADAIPPRH